MECGTETDMIELTEQQRHELSVPEPIAIDPLTQDAFSAIRQPTMPELQRTTRLKM